APSPSRQGHPGIRVAVEGSLFSFKKPDDLLVVMLFVVGSQLVILNSRDAVSPVNNLFRRPEPRFSLSRRVSIFRVPVIHKQKNRHWLLYIVWKKKDEFKFMAASFMLTFDHYPP